MAGDKPTKSRFEQLRDFGRSTVAAGAASAALLTGGGALAQTTDAPQAISNGRANVTQPAKKPGYTALKETRSRGALAVENCQLEQALVTAIVPDASKVPPAQCDAAQPKAGETQQGLAQRNGALKGNVKGMLKALSVSRA